MKTSQMYSSISRKTNFKKRIRFDRLIIDGTETASKGLAYLVLQPPLLLPNLDNRRGPVGGSKRVLWEFVEGRFL